MEIVYALEELPSTINKSIFLAGPTPRDTDGNPWRKDAIKILEDIGFDGTVFVPEPRDGEWKKDYDAQLEWEELCLNAADCIAFWVPRDLKDMPAFTTNIEWGRWEASGKLVLGYPEDAEKMTYMTHYAKKLNIALAGSITETMQDAIDFIKEGADRTGGERMVPLYIWKTTQFQSWYNQQVVAGNRLDDCRVLFDFRPGNKKFVFLWVLHVDMYIASEDRHKTNEFVLARTDISSVLLWKRAEPVEASEIVLVREYRSPARTPDGFIRELPGGSATDNDDAAEVAASEVEEETGMSIKSDRLKSEGSRQIAGTLSSHHGHLFSVEITDEEIEWFKAQKDEVHGNIDDTEQCYIEVVTLKELIAEPLTDWAIMGMILSVVYKGDL